MEAVAVHGSERRLASYRGTTPAFLDRVILAEIDQDAELAWVYPSADVAQELDSAAFLRRAAPLLSSEWKDAWPQRGKQQMWDGIARVHAGDWLLLEAKANEPEFVGSPCAAGPDGQGRKRIQRTLNATKTDLGVPRDFSWLGSYYQYANRLAFLGFLRKHNVPARLVFVHFCGEVFPDGRPCPASPEEWGALIEARRRTLGLPREHALTDRVHDVFLPAVPTAI